MMLRRAIFRTLIPVAVLAIVAAWPESSQALTMTPRPPTVLINSTTDVDISWSTNVAAGPNHVWYGKGGPEWTTNTGLVAGDTIRDIDVFDSNRAFMVASTASSTGRLYVGNRAVGGQYTWSVETTIPYIPNAVAAQDYNTVWYAGYSTTVTSRKIEQDSTTSFTVSLGAPNVVWSIDEAAGTVWVAGTSSSIFSYNTSTSGPVVTRVTGITSIDPSVNRYTDIDAFDANAVWAVSDRYVSASFNAGAAWVNWNPGTSAFIEDIKSVSSTLAYGVGRNGWIYKMSGTATAGWTSTNIGASDLLSLGAGGPNMLMAFGCCASGSFDVMSVSYDGTNWSAMQTLTTSLTSSSADFTTPTSGFRGGSGARIEQYQAIYSNVVTNTTVAVPHTVGLSAGLQEGVTYHASADSYIQTGLNTYTESAESGDFTFKTTSLDVSSLTVTPQTTSATIDWGTTLNSDTRAYVSPSIGWEVNNGALGSTLTSISATGDSVFVGGRDGDMVGRSSGYSMASSWSSVSGAGADINAVSMIGTHGWAVGNSGIILHTTNGSTWSAQPSGVSVTLLGVYAFDPMHAWVVGQNIILRTVDGGNSWQVAATPAVTYRDVVATDVNTVLVAGDAVSILRSVDGGTTWVPATVNTTPTSFLSVTMNADGQNGWASGTIGIVVRTTDGGRTWNQVFSGCVSTEIYGIDVGSTSDMWLVGANGTLRHWTGGGTACADLANETFTGLTSSTHLYGVDVSGNDVWVVGVGGLIARKGLLSSSPQYRAVLRDTVTGVTSHTTLPLTGLTPNTTYNFFIQSNDPAGAIVVRNNTFTTLPVPSLELSTTALSFSMVEGGADPADQTFEVRGQSNANVGNWTALKTSGGTWLNLPAPTSGSSTPTTVTVSIDAAGLPSSGSPYTGTFRIDATDPGVLNTPQTVTVTLTVSPPPILALSTNSLNFSAEAGAPNPAPQAVSVSNAGSGILSYTLVNASGSPWMNFTSSGSSPYQAPNQVVVAPNIVGLTPGVYTGSITVTGGAGTQNSPQTITVTLTITTPPTLDVTWPGKPAPITFSASQGGPNPPPFTGLSVRNSGGGTMSWTSTSSTGWLTSTPTSDGNGPTGVTVQAITGSLPPSGGTPYMGTININAGSAGTFAVPVEFTVAAAPVLSATPSSLTFSTPQGTNPPTQNISITSGAPAGWSVTITSGTWLRLPGTNTGTIYPTNVPVGVEVVTTGLAVGTYNGSIQVASAGALPATMNIPVTLQVTAPPVLQILPTPPVAPFTTEEGKNPAPQVIQIDNIGGPSTVMNWSIAQPAETWLRLSTGPCSGSFPTSVIGTNVEGNPPTDVNVCVDVTAPTLLTPGSYTSSFTVTAPGAFSQPQTINVQLTVTSDTSGPQLAPGSLSITTGFDCSTTPADVFANIRWTTNEYGDSQVYWGETTTGGVPDYELGSLVRDGVDTVNHTGGVINHDVLLDNLAGGHRYYIKFRSTDRYGNVGAFTDHDPANPALYLSVLAPAACDTTPPTNVVLTVPPGTLFGTVNVNISAQDESGIQRFEIWEVGAPFPTAMVSVPPGACVSLGTTYSCLVTYGFATNSLPDGTHQLFARAYDAVGNQADSAPVTVVISNSVPVVSNITATPTNVGGVWQAEIAWDTDKPSNSRVDYGIETPPNPFIPTLRVPDGGDYTDSVTSDDSGCTNCTSGSTRHRVTLPNLTGGRIYHFQVTSCAESNPALCGH